MKDYLIQDKAGVIDMCLTEYDAERHMQLVAEEIAEKDAIIDKQKEENAKLALQNAALQEEIRRLKSMKNK